MDVSLLSRSSLRPPIHRFVGDLARTPRPDWILLDVSGYILNRRNSTTATCRCQGDKELQVTFFPAHPPQVSYFCVYCVGMTYSMEPKIIATNGNHVFFRVNFGTLWNLLGHYGHEYFVYTAAGGGGSPSVEAIPDPRRVSRGFSHHQAGLLSSSGGYTIVALLDDTVGTYKAWSLNQYELCIFSSKDKVWTSKYVDRPAQRPRECRHDISKVLTIGGEGGTIAFVDLWHGMILYDVLGDDDSLRYVELPKPEAVFGNPASYRDVAYVNGHIKFVGITADPDPVPGTSEVATWSISMPAATSSQQESAWICCQSIQVSKIRDEQQLLPPAYNQMLNVNTEGRRPTMETLRVGHPTLSLHDDHTVYFMTKVRTMDKEACIVAVDMSSCTIQGAAKFDAARTGGLNFTYTSSRISSFLNISSRYQGRK